MTYEDSLSSIINVNSNLLKLKCSESCDSKEIKLVKSALKKQVETALLCKKETTESPKSKN